MNNLVSIIMPVYNSDEFLTESISSVLVQTYQNFELILINDDSTDKSLEICKRMSNLDSRIILFNNLDNLGPSKSRNQGIKIAKGKYITFIDADDIYAPNLIEELVLNLENNKAEISTIGYSYNLEDIYEKQYNMNVQKHTVDYFISELCLNRKIKGFVWNKLYLKKVIDNNHILFNERLDYCEDYFFNLNYLEYITTGVVSTNILYYYRQLTGSLSHSISLEKEKSIINLLESKKDFYLSLGKSRFAANLEMLISEKLINLYCQNIKLKSKRKIQIKMILHSDLFSLNKVFMFFVEKCKLSPKIYSLLLKIEYKTKLLK